MDVGQWYSIGIVVLILLTIVILVAFGRIIINLILSIILTILRAIISVIRFPFDALRRFLRG